MEPSSQSSCSSSSSLNETYFVDNYKLQSDIVPEEIWLLLIENKLIKKKSETEDISRRFQLLINSSLYFRELLSSKKTLYLFPNVFPLIIPHLLLPPKTNDKVQEDFTLSSETSTLNENPDENKWSLLSPLLKPRAVCSTWCIAADKIFQNGNIRFQDPSTSSFNCSLFESEIIVNNINHVSFNNSLDVLEFLDHFSLHLQQKNNAKSRSPFISGRVSIKLSHGLYNNHGEDISTLLNKFGKGIHVLDLELINDFPSMLECFGRLRECLIQASNLTKLKLTHGCLTEASFNSWGEVQLNLEENELQFPKLVELEIHYIPNVMFKKVVQRNTHVSKLKVCCDYTHEYSYIFTLSFPKLEELGFQFSSLDDIVTLGNINCHDWPLKKLSLSFSRNMEFVRWSKLFTTLETFGTTLEILEVELPPVAKNLEEYKIILEDTATGYLNLPKLKTLELHFSQKIYLDFILPLKGSLEQLRLYKDWGPAFQPSSEECDDPYSNEQFISVDAIQEENMQESKIWKLFPKMERIFISRGNGDCLELTRK